MITADIIRERPEVLFRLSRNAPPRYAALKKSTAQEKAKTKETEVGWYRKIPKLMGEMAPRPMMEKKILCLKDKFIFFCKKFELEITLRKPKGGIQSIAIKIKNIHHAE